LVKEVEKSHGKTLGLYKIYMRAQYKESSIEADKKKGFLISILFNGGLLKTLDPRLPSWEYVTQALDLGLPSWEYVTQALDLGLPSWEYVTQALDLGLPSWEYVTQALDLGDIG